MESRLNMLAAVQPFISGGISCTFNLPAGISSDVVGSCYRKAHDAGIKCMTVYVDGSKKSQPLNRPSSMTWWDCDVPQQQMLLRGQRKKPPHTQDGFMVRVAINGDGRVWKTWIHFYEDDNGDPCEVWVDISNENEFYRVAMEMWGRAVSNSLQYGQPLEELASSYIGSTGGPSGTTDHPNITYCTSVPDLIFKLMLMHYRGETQWCKRKPRPDELRMNWFKKTTKANPIESHVGAGVSGVFVEKHNVLKCPVCGASGDAINMFPCPTCTRCGTSLGGCSP
jgi:ribonucleoside-diphosphate reductase alpha chain